MRKKSAKTKMNASKNTVKNVTAQILAAETDHRRSVRSAGIGEQRNDAFRCKLDRDRSKHAKACGEHHRIAQRLNGPPGLPAPIFCAPKAETVDSIEEGTKREN